MSESNDTKEEVKPFTGRELEIMAKAWNCMVEEPKIDYAKLAEECSMTNVRSASNAWSGIKKKILAKAGVASEKAGGEDRTPARVKATPRKRVAKKADVEGEGDDAEGTGSPRKKARTPKVKGKGKGKGGEEVDDGEVGEGKEGEGIKKEEMDGGV